MPSRGHDFVTTHWWLDRTILPLPSSTAVTVVTLGYCAPRPPKPLPPPLEPLSVFLVASLSVLLRIQVCFSCSPWQTFLYLCFPMRLLLCSLLLLPLPALLQRRRCHVFASTASTAAAVIVVAVVILLFLYVFFWLSSWPVPSSPERLTDSSVYFLGHFETAVAAPAAVIMTSTTLLSTPTTMAAPVRTAACLSAALLSLAFSSGG